MDLSYAMFATLFATHQIRTAHILIDMLTKYMLDHPGVPLILMGDFNAHHKEWLCSAVPTDFAGIATQEFCESFGLHQYVDFPTRGPNTLDLVNNCYVYI